MIRKGVSFNLEIWKLIANSYIKISKTLYYTYPKPRSVKIPPQSSFFVPLWKISSLFWKIQSSKSFVVEFGRFIKLCALELCEKRKLLSPNFELFFKSFTLVYFKKVKRSIDQKKSKRSYANVPKIYFNSHRKPKLSRNQFIFFREDSKTPVL